MQRVLPGYIRPQSCIGDIDGGTLSRHLRCRAVTANRPCPESVTVENKSSLIVAAILVVLIGLALWQFYSLAWGDVLRSSYVTGTGGSRGGTSIALTM